MRLTRADLLNKRFGKLIVLSFDHLDKYRHAYWNCLCDCGHKICTSSRQLMSRGIKSCGCIRIKKGKYNAKWKGCGDLSSTYMIKCKNGAKRRKLEYNITIRQCWDLFLNQNKKCKLSGLPLTFNSTNKKHDGTASLDRIDSNKGYTIDNIQWIHKDINQMKMELNEQYFLDLVKTISNYQGNIA